MLVFIALHAYFPFKLDVDILKNIYWAIGNINLEKRFQNIIADTMNWFLNLESD